MKNPYYDLVPKDKKANLKFRKKILREAWNDEDAARDFWIMSSRDPLFYINTFVWTYDPRKEPSAIPFITWDFQDNAFDTFFDCIGKEDMLTEKSRDMGASWIYLTGTEWLWHFDELKSFLFVSRVQDLVDKTEDPDSLFWKIDFILKNQPAWLRPNINRNKLHIYNIDTGSTLDGVSTTGDVARGGRRTAILLDEFASVDDGYAVLRATRDATNCRLFNSTPKGVGNAFYDMTRTNIRKLRFHWSQHPEKSLGLYCVEDGQLHIIDTDFVFPDNFNFILDGKIRSPWYDIQCKRAAHPMEIAQELDIDYLNSDFQFFSGEVLEHYQKNYIKSAYVVGEVDYDVERHIPHGFEYLDGGRLNLWANPDSNGNLGTSDYVIGADISAGTMASNSCLSIGDATTSEKIGEFISAGLKPHELAKVAVVLARWLKGLNGGARLIWEANGPGREFGDTVVELGYRNIYYRENEKSLSKKTSDVPGWFSTKENKLALLGEYRKALKDELFINRSYEAIRECREYVFTTNGSVEHSRSMHSVDPSGARDNHGDRVIADALCWKIMKSSAVSKETKIVAPEDCLFARRQEYQNRIKTKMYW